MRERDFRRGFYRPSKVKKGEAEAGVPARAGIYLSEAAFSRRVGKNGGDGGRRKARPLYSYFFFFFARELCSCGIRTLLRILLSSGEKNAGKIDGSLCMCKRVYVIGCIYT